MAAFASGIFSHVSSAAHTLSSPSPNASPVAEASSSDGTGSTSAAASTISANDFLTLLVTEMKNQDPTANTDPNEYINQLVNVNSLEQLIDINQNLSEALGNPSGNSRVSGSVSMPASLSAHAVPQTGQATSPLASQSISSTPGGYGNFDALQSALKLASGNLATPKAAPAAQSLAHALDGNDRSHAAAIGVH